jgi:hypothetical protein
LIALLVLPAFGARQNGLRGLDAVVFGSKYFALTDRVYPVAGAGQGGFGVWNVIFNPHWITNPGSDEVEGAPVQVAGNFQG